MNSKQEAKLRLAGYYTMEQLKDGIIPYKIQGKEYNFEEVEALFDSKTNDWLIPLIDTNRDEIVRLVEVLRFRLNNKWVVYDLYRIKNKDKTGYIIDGYGNKLIDFIGSKYEQVYCSSSLGISFSLWVELKNLGHSQLLYIYRGYYIKIEVIGNIIGCGDSVEISSKSINNEDFITIDCMLRSGVKLLSTEISVNRNLNFKVKSNRKKIKLRVTGTGNIPIPEDILNGK